MKPDDVGVRKKSVALVEVIVVLAALITGFRVLGRAMIEVPGSGAINQFVVLALGTMVLLLLLRRRLGDFGITFSTPGPSLTLAFRAWAVVGPAGMVFWLLQVMGTSPDQWVGSGLATLAFLVAMPIVILVTARLPTREPTAGNSASVVRVALGLGAAVLVSVWLATEVPLLSKLLYYALIVGFSEEILFRGYVQSRLNQVFGRRWEWRGISFGPGLILAALAFGLAHTFVGSGWIWQRSFYTFAYGLTLGLIREKDGSVLGPALLHGLGDCPLTFFG